MTRPSGRIALAMAPGNPLFTANASVWSNQSNENPFVTAMEANSRTYLPAYQTMTVFGL